MQRGYEMIVRILNRFDVSLLRQIPNTNAIVVAHGDEVLARRMEYQIANPILMALEK